MNAQERIFRAYQLADDQQERIVNMLATHPFREVADIIATLIEQRKAHNEQAARKAAEAKAP